MATSYQLNPHLRVVRRSDDEVLVSRGSRSVYAELLRDDAGTGLLADLLDRLADPVTAEELAGTAARAGGAVDVRTLLKDLHARGVVVTADTSAERAHLDTFVGSGLATGPGTVAVVGGGRLARQVADGLRASGAAEAGLQVAHHPLDAGGEFDAEALFADTALLVAALDRPEDTLLHELNEAALRQRRAWMEVCLDGGEAVVGPTHVPLETACHLEFALQSDASLGFVGHVLELRHSRTATGPTAAPPPHQVGIAAGFAVEACLRHVSDGGNFTVDRALRIDLERMEIDHQDVLRLPRCPACGPHRMPHRNAYL